MKKNFILVVFLTLVVPIFSCSAATLYSNDTGGGNWDDPNSWDGANTPTDMVDGDTVVIQAGDTITISDVITFDFDIVLQIYGVLVLDNGKLNMEAASVIQFAPGSDIIVIGTGQNNSISIGGQSNDLNTDQLDTLSIPNQLTDGSISYGGCAVTQDCDDNPLPVEIIYFRAIEIDNAVRLEWATSNEENFDYFTIERSSDGTIFNDRVNIFSESPDFHSFRKYEYTDEMPFSGLSYYRLKATDLDGSIEYHGVVSVNLVDVEPDILIYPNPMVKDQLIVSFNGVNESIFKVMDITGRIMETGTIVPGINDIHISPTINNSIYFFQVEGLNKTLVKKFIIR